MVKSLFVKRDFFVFNQDWIYLTMRIRVDGYLKLLRALSKKKCCAENVPLAKYPIGVLYLEYAKGKFIC